MINSFQLIDAYQGLAIDQSSQDPHIDAFLDYLKQGDYRQFSQPSKEAVSLLAVKAEALV